ncbi:MAG: AI-2E family transporter, partial [Clostridia bacterium]|nr:AI-2E family transporter [Clostridia bacterium]
MKLKLKNCLLIAGTVFLLYLAIFYWPAVSGFVKAVYTASVSIIIGAVIAYVLNILMTFYERHYFSKTKKPALIKSRRPVCMVLAILTLIAVVALVVALVLPQFVSCIVLLVDKIPSTVGFIADKLERWNLITPEVAESLASTDWMSRVEQIMGSFKGGIGGMVDIAIGTVTSVFSTVITTFLAVIFAVYILASKDKLHKQANRLMACYLKDRHISGIRYVLGVFDGCFHSYIVGQCLEALILGALCTVGMLLLRMPYATMIGALMAFTALIPIAGAWIGAGVGAFMILTVSPVKALIFLVFILVLQQIEGNLIYPKVVGSSIGLPGIWVLVAVTVGGGIFGVPLSATVYRLVGNHVRKKENLSAQ